MLIKQTKERKLTKKVLISIGGLTMLLGAPLALVVACSDTSVATFESDNISDVSIFVPNENGEITESLTGWDVDIVSSDELSTPLTNLNLNAVTNYRIRFTLKSDYILPADLDSELTLIDGSYYSDVKTYTNHAENVSDLSMLNINSDGEIDITFTGWDIDIVEMNNGQPFIKTSLSVGDDYFIRFTLQSNYAVPTNFGVIAMRTNFPNDKAYYSERITHQSKADDIVSFDTIFPNENGMTNSTLVGWDVDVVSPTSSETSLTTLHYGAGYQLRFTLQANYLISDNINSDLIPNENGSYYSQIRPFYSANELNNNIDNIVSDRNGNANIEIEGWEIDVVDNNGVALTSLAVNDSYWLKFTLFGVYTLCPLISLIV